MRLSFNVIVITPILALSAVVFALPAYSRTIFANGFEAVTLVTSGGGGTNYLWFGDDGLCQQSSRDAYGLLKRYHETDPQLGPVRDVARQQLAQMRAGGMRRLSLGVYFMHQPAPSGTLVDSSDPVEVAQVAVNLAQLLADVKAANFNGVLFRLFATNNINPSQPEFPAYGTTNFWPRVDEYWNLIEALRPALAASGVPYRIDLMVEGAPRDSNPVWIPESERYKYPANDTWSRAVRALWQRYVAAYGRGDTVGFSFIVDEDNNRMRSRVRHMRYVHEGTYPQIFALDIYAGTSPSWDEYEKFVKMDGYMRSQNPAGASWDRAGWIVSEAYYEDLLAAQALANAIRDTGRTVYYLTQWPLDRAGACQQPHVNVPPPYEWQVWPGSGF
ncbi:hypothetical protein OS187_02395 [Xanthomonadaceae bacterium JHOS43]|nr:hypothetical protein [Xanthomonadaceae bacterium JHOS43]